MFATNIADVPFGIGILIAFGGGILSFLSPCVLPIVPGYLSMVTGLSFTDLQTRNRDRLIHIFRDTILFIGGFTAVFVLLGMLSTKLTASLIKNQVFLTRISGGLLIILSLYLVGSQLLMRPGMYREVRFHPSGDLGWFAAPIVGAAFGFGWTPCIGPVLASILTIASQQGSAWRAGTLLFMYGMGLGIPFLVVGVLFGELTGTMKWLKRHSVLIMYISAALLFFFGVVLVFDKFGSFTAHLNNLFNSVGLKRLVTFG